MKLLELLRRESTASVGGLLVLAGLAGISNALVLAVINASAQQTSSGGPRSTRNIVLFAIIMATYAVSQWKLYSTATSEIEKILDRIRVRLADKIRRCDLLPLETLGQTVIYAGITRDTTTISQAATLVIMAAQAAVLVVFTALYVAVLSLVAFGLTAIIAVFLSILHLRRARAMGQVMHELSVRENDMFDSLTHFLDGFKEVRMNRARSDDLFTHFTNISHEATERKCYTHQQIARTFIFSQLSFYLLLGVITFVVPTLGKTTSGSVAKTTAAVLFLVGPITTLVGTVPNLAVADAAVENVRDLEKALDQSLSAGFDRFSHARKFREIEFENVVFHYHDLEYGGRAAALSGGSTEKAAAWPPHSKTTGETFTVGPINLKLKAGETVFIAGGNGSGKSTFLKLLTALYHPQQGVIRVDGRALTPESYESYRSLFSTVFTDYHLFDRLYGLGDVPQEAIDEQLELVELTAKTRVVDSRFETLELSGGQRKRLALLVSLLENRPICMFDEMAADQDPAFRRKFYKEILPLLRANGHTVIVVTHDDKYFGDADRLLRMDEGRFVSDEQV